MENETMDGASENDGQIKTGQEIISEYMRDL